MKKLLIVILSVLVLAGAAFVIAGTVITRSNEASFPASGYILDDGDEGVQQLRFDSGIKYGTQKAGKVSFKGSEGGTVEASSESFAHLDNDSVIAFSDGVLIDFNDLSDNFINNYYIVSGLEVEKTGNGYSAYSSAGTINFGDHVMKLSDNDYIVRSPKIKVHLNDKDTAEAEGFAEVHIDESGLVHIVTADNSWTTISEDCYIETAGGVQINPVTQIINDGTYMMSLAKLSVSPDDCIVLTEDETVRQVVPEFDVNAIDGKDGTAGGTGGAGASGSEGAAGGAGAQGSTGTTGKEGEDGKKGTAGETGGTGTGGESGADGADGSAGSSGSDGSTGTTGSEGTGGSSGTSGTNAEAGKNAVGDSSVFKSLPQMGITDWVENSTSLKGAITVSGESEALEIDTTSSDAYLGKVVIINEETGEEITCYETDETYNTKIRDDGKVEGFTKGDEIVYFATDENVLEPDTAYRLIVTAYYTFNNSIYAREFLTRSFVTDSTGLFVDKRLASENELTVRAYVPDSYQIDLQNAAALNKVTVASIVFLTAEQNEKFSAPGGDIGTSEYTTVYKLDYANGETYKNYINTGDSPSYDMNLTFDGLNSDTKYYVRSIVETTSGTKMLSKSVLELRTLKTAPTWTGKPEVSWNRATGAFQVYRPAITDPNMGITGYTYTVYDSAGNVVQTRDVSTETAEPIQFYLASNESYQFGVKLKFNDNEKDIEYDIGKSDAISSSGDPLPNVTLKKDMVQFNKMQGTITIDLSNPNTSLLVDAAHPVIVKAYSDEVAYQYYGMNNNDSKAEIEIELDGKTDIKTDRVTASLEYTSGGNEAVISLTLSSLYKSSNYALTITGYLDLNDSEDADVNSLVRRSIGTVSFRTTEPPIVNCSFSSNSSGDTIGQTLKLVPIDTDEAANTYAADQIKKGKVTLALYSGTGVGAQLMQSKTITDETTLTELVGEGVEITDSMFGQSLEGGQDYTLAVSSVSDATGNSSGLGYTNYFDLKNEKKAIVAGIQPPKLSTDPAHQVEYYAIKNSEANKYGGTVNEKLDDDVIVGYKLTAKYDNSSRIAKSITYYVLDYAEFYGTLINGGKDPIGYDQDGTKTPDDPDDNGTAKLMTMTQKVYTDSETAPSVTFFFGRDPQWPTSRTTPTSDNPDEEYPAYYDTTSKSYVYYSGPNIGRGYKYLFAYTVVYNTTGAEDDDKMYPYDHTDYDSDLKSYKIQYGAGTENNQWLGKGVAYILNSGMVDCPRIDPQINTFLYSAESTNCYSQDGEYVAEGTTVVYYTYDDLDKTLITTSSKEDNTQIVYNDTSGTYDYSQAINDSDYAVDGVSKWYSYTMKYIAKKDDIAETVLSPKIQISRYMSNYYNIMVNLGYTDDAGNLDGTSDYYLCHIPLDFAYGLYIGTDAGTTGLCVDASIDELKNIITFTVDTAMAGADEEFRDEVCGRTYKMKLKFYEVDPDTREKKNGGIELGPIETELTYKQGSYKADMSTGKLSKFVGKFFAVEGELLYDTGDMGWKYIGNGNQYSMQYINGSGDESNTFRLNDYVYSSSGSTPMGYLKTQYSNTAAETLIKNTGSSKTTIVVGGDGNLYTNYYYADHYGVDRSDSSSYGSDYLSGRYVVPKTYGTYKLGTTANAKYQYLNEITPAVKLNYTLTMTQLSFWDASISSDKLEENNEVYIRVYKNKKDAAELNDNFVKYQTVEADKKTGKMDIPNITGLEPETDYYITVSMIKDGAQSFVLKDGSEDEAIYEISTKTGIKITSAYKEFVYENNSYFSKLATYNFSVSPWANFHARYDIYSSEDAAETKTGEPLLSDEKMREAGILDAPEAFVKANNDITISLEPSEGREKLKPGKEYYVRITILDPDLTTEAGYKVVKLAIDEATGTRGFIYTEDATAESITFQLTLNDWNYSVMGRKAGSEESGPFYAVRFTGSDGHLMKTSYDDKVYSFNDPIPTFKLSEETLTFWSSMDSQRIVASTHEEQHKYQMHVYCVIDKEHNGKSPAVDAGGTTKDWKYFYNGSGSGEFGFAQGFLDMLDSFWDSSTYAKTTDPDLLKVEANFKLVSAEQTSTSTDGFYVSYDGMYPERSTEAAIKIVFKDSYGLILNNVQQFNKISWTVKGRDKNNKIIDEQGITTYEDEPGKMIKYEYDSILRSYVYKFEIPYELTKGNYQIQVALYRNKDDEAPYESKTMDGTY